MQETLSQPDSVHILTLRRDGIYTKPNFIETILSTLSYPNYKTVKPSFPMKHPISMCNAHTLLLSRRVISITNKGPPHAFCVINNFWLAKASKWISNMFTGHIKLILNEMNLY